MSIVYLVRHAKAGSRGEWEGDDQLRPLSNKGWQQAEAVANKLARRATGKLYSSPYLRCVQTLEPLAQKHHEPVVADDRLAEDAGFEGALELLATLPNNSVLCSHGDVIPATIAALERRGCEITGRPDWRKASVWVLKRDAEGMVTSAACWPPPHKN